MAGQSPQQALQPNARLIVYGRQWCHLCEEMLAALAPVAAEFGARIEVIDVDTDPVLEARYDELVPVLMLDGIELSRYRLDEPRVRAALDARRAGGTAKSA
ncbi:glutaredoxin family protein [Trinickia caryophylli]|nr:glutaredoxin family protein [Trinickia caryophylli]PMS09228.1 glutaredoxin family protein [Trinickia caryophylli]TRX20240.1 glutaredoxin family protein [Trinickia caryophylli]WQE13761.1 glutaredoxin family protein [Trinickia caryophylli]GLU32380.1 glutaredoxin family protein [Trinickia caryophylli]